MTCPNDRRLFEVHTGGGTPAERTHAAACEACMARLRALADDLALIDGVVGGPIPRLRARRPARAWRLAPLAIAAAIVVAIVLARREDTTADAWPSGTDPFTLADEVATLVGGDVASEVETTATSTCTYGDPLLGVGCDEPPVMRIAWR